MNKIFALLLPLSLLGASCSDEPAVWRIEFETNGGTPVASIKVSDGEKAAKPSDPTKEGAIFDCWYVDSALTTEFDWDEPVTASWKLYAGWESEVDAPDDTSSSSTEEDGPFTIYFRDAAWWNTAEAATSISFNGEEGLGERMEHLRFCPTENTSIGYNYWSFEIEDPAQIETITFHRVNGDGSQYWGAATVEIDFSEKGGNNLYDIKETTEAWSNQGNFVSGVWGVYDPDDVGNPDAESPEQEGAGAYIVGEGSFVDGEEWKESSGIEFSVNPSNAQEYMALDVSLAPGDKLQIKNGQTYCGYSGIEAGCDLKGTHFESDDDGNILVKTAGIYDFYYKVPSNTLWISL